MYISFYLVIVVGGMSLVQLSRGVQERILLYLDQDDYRQLSACDKKHRQMLKPYLWNDVELSYSKLLNLLQNDGAKDLIYTIEILVELTNDGEDDGKEQSARVDSSIISSLSQYCDPQILRISDESQKFGREKSKKSDELSQLADFFQSISKFSRVQELVLWTMNSEVLKTNFHTICNANFAEKLKYLTIYGATVNSGVLVQMGKLSSLEELEIRSCSVPDDVMECIGQISTLKTLLIQNCRTSSMWMMDDYSTRVSDGLHHIQDIALKHLDLESCHITADGLAAIFSMTSLEVLNVTGNLITCGNGIGVTSKGMEDIVALDHLVELQVKFNKIKDEGMKFLGELCTLKILDVGVNNLTDKGVGR